MTPTVCAGDCHRPLVPKATLNVPEGHARFRGRGLCEACYARARRAGTLGDYTTAHSPESLAARVEDVEFLLQYDRNAASVATRAGFPSPVAAARFLSRLGRNDLAQKLARYAHTRDVYADSYGHAEHRAAA